MVRPSKLEYYMNIAKEVSRRSNCLSAQFGAIIVKDDQIISTGYNGAPRKTKDCMDYGSCLRRELKIPSGERYELCRTVHAEQNAIINAARSGVSVLGGTMYIYGVRVHSLKEPELIDSIPCFICKKILINAGLDNLVAMMKDGKPKEFEFAAWTEEWSSKDMTGDIQKYSTSYSDEKD